MKVVTRSAAMRMVPESLFRPGGTLAGRGVIRFDGGKYRASMVGRDIPSNMVPDGPVWCERRTDADGPYWALFCFRRAEPADYDARCLALEAEGLTRSDAQAVVDAARSAIAKARGE